MRLKPGSSAGRKPFTVAGDRAATVAPWFIWARARLVCASTWAMSGAGVDEDGEGGHHSLGARSRVWLGRSRSTGQRRHPDPRVGLILLATAASSSVTTNKATTPCILTIEAIPEFYTSGFSFLSCQGNIVAVDKSSGSRKSQPPSAADVQEFIANTEGRA